MRLRTGSNFTLRKGNIIRRSTNQKVNARSTTESELIGVDDIITKIARMCKFIEYEGFEFTLSIIYQDNTSAIKLISNGMSSSGKRTMHFDKSLFYAHDLVGISEVKIEY